MASIEGMAWDRLRSMKDPGSRRDIVTLGLVSDLQIAGDIVKVVLAPPVSEAYQHEALAAAIRRELGALGGVDKVSVSWTQAAETSPESASSAADSSPAPCTGRSTAPSPEAIAAQAMDPSLRRVGVAPEVGYGEAGPQQLPSPELEIPDDRYEGWPPVFQWEIDPADPALVSGEASVTLGDWEYEIWWQAHPADIVFASIQALCNDTVTGGPERQHPMGRNVVVNLAYDRRREAVVTVYGTARDFRPFIEAFRIGCNIEKRPEESNE